MRDYWIVVTWGVVVLGLVVAIAIVAVNGTKSTCLKNHTPVECGYADD